MPQNQSLTQDQALTDDIVKLEFEVQSYRKPVTKLKDRQKRFEGVYLWNETKTLLDLYEALIIGASEDLLNQTRARLENKLDRLQSIITKG